MFPMAITLDMFAKEPETARFEAGQTIFRRGDPGSEMFVILEGEVELTIRESLVVTLGPLEPFGEMALINHRPRVATAVARTACRLVGIPEKRFLFLVEETPFFALHMLRILAERLRRMDGVA
jgi:CRP/FNR family cyclic AMP-dependent transcriptional regulator